MLIKDYELTLALPPCDPDSERCSAFAKLDTDISAVLPYLNATLRGAIYDHKAQTLTWRTGRHAISFRPHEIAVSNVEDRNEAEDVVQRMVQLVNDTWQRREQIQPSLEKRQPPRALDIYKLLPGQNCKACGQPTCFTFALKVVAGQASIKACTPLFSDEFSSQRKQLLQMLQAAGMIEESTEQ